MKKKRQIIWHQLFLGLTMLFFGSAMASMFQLYHFLYALVTFSLSLNGFFILLFVSLFLSILLFQATNLIYSARREAEIVKSNKADSFVDKAMNIFSRMKMLFIVIVMIIFIVTSIDHIDMDFLLKHYAMGLFFSLAVIFFFLAVISFLVISG